MIEKNDALGHDVVIKSRKRLEMSGINEVLGFDEKEVMAQTGNVSISIEGEKLKIERFDAEKGELVINGTINGLFYYNKDISKKKKGFASFFK